MEINKEATSLNNNFQISIAVIARFNILVYFSYLRNVILRLCKLSFTLYFSAMTSYIYFRKSVFIEILINGLNFYLQLNCLENQKHDMKK